MSIERVVYELIARDKASREFRKVADEAAKAAAKVDAAQRAQADSAGKLRVAEAKLAEVRSRKKSQASTVVAAEERVAKARRDGEAALSRLTAAEKHLANMHDPVIHPHVDTREADRALNRLQRKINHMSRGRAIIQVAIAAAPLAVPAGAALLGGGAGLATILGAGGAGALTAGILGTAALKHAQDLQKQSKQAGTKSTSAQTAQLHAQQRLAAAEASYAHARKKAIASQAASVEAAERRLSKAQSNLSYAQKRAAASHASRVSSAQQRVARDEANLAYAQKHKNSTRGPSQSVASARAALAKAEASSSSMRGPQASVASAQLALQQAKAKSPDLFSHAQSVAKARTALAEATKKANAAEKAHEKIQKQITTGDKRALAALASLKKAWYQFLGGGPGAALLKMMASGFKLLQVALKPLGIFLKPVSAGVSSMLKAFGRFSQSKMVMQFAKALGDMSGQVLKASGPMLINLTKGFISLFKAFMPLGKQMLPALVKMTAAFAKWSAGLSKTSGFKSFMSYVRKSGPVVMKTLVDLANTIIQLIIALAPLGLAMLRGVDSVAKWITTFSKAHPSVVRFVAVLIVAANAMSILAQPLSKAIDLFKLMTSPLIRVVKWLHLGSAATKLMGKMALGTRLGLLRLAAAQKARALIEKASTLSMRAYIAVDNAIGRAALGTRAKLLLETAATKAKTVAQAIAGKASKIYAATIELVGSWELRTRAKTVAMTVATYAWATAQKVAGVASRIFAVAVRLAGIAVKFALGPVGLIIIGLAALAAGLVYAYKHSETFRNIVNAVWAAVQKAAMAVLRWFTGPFINFFTKTVPHVFSDLVTFIKQHWKAILVGIVAGPVGLAVLAIIKHYGALKSATLNAVKWVVDKFLWFAQQIINGAAKAFGWIPGIGGKLKSAAKAFQHFRDRVNRALSQIESHKQIDIYSKYHIKGINANHQLAVLRDMNHADGYTVPKRGGMYGDYHPAILADGEEVISNRHGEADRYRAMRATGLLHMADGGGIGIGTPGLSKTTQRVIEWIRAVGKNINLMSSAIKSSLSKALNSLLVPSGPTPRGPLEHVAKVLLSRYGWANQWNAFNAIEMSEAGWNIHARNPSSGAYGLAQALPPSKYASAGSDWRTNGTTQLRWMMAYIASRYGNPANAWAFHLAHNWYANGTRSAAPGLAWVGERGPELVRFKGGEEVIPHDESVSGTDRDGRKFYIYATSDKASEIVKALSWYEKEASLAGVYRR